MKILYGYWSSLWKKKFFFFFFFFVITKYYPLSNSNEDAVLTDMNNIESSPDSDISNKVYKINIKNNSNRNNIVFNNSIW